MCICNEAVHTEPRSLTYILDHFKTQDMCNEAVVGNAYTLGLVPDHLKTQEMCNMAMGIDPAVLLYS